MIYRQIDENGVCIAIIRAKGEIKKDNYIPCDKFDDSVVGKMKYVNGKWEEVPPPPKPDPAYFDTSGLETTVEGQALKALLEHFGIAEKSK